MFPPPLLWLLFISKSRVLIFNAPLAWAQTLMNKPQLNAREKERKTTHTDTQKGIRIKTRSIVWAHLTTLYSLYILSPKKVLFVFFLTIQT
jgi:hypothetical protein